MPTGKTLKTILGEEGKSYNSAKLSPSGKWLAFQFGTTAFVDIPALAIIPVNGTLKDIVTIPFDRNKGNFSWSNDEKYIYFGAQSNGGAPIYRADIQTKKVDTIIGPSAGVSGFDLRNDKIVFVKTVVADPWELYTISLQQQNSKRASAISTTGSKQKTQLPREKKFRK
jgi:Tol biopolymer transport system component